MSIIEWPGPAAPEGARGSTQRPRGELPLLGRLVAARDGRLAGGLCALAVYLTASLLLFGLPILAHLGRDCLCVSSTTDEGIPAWGLAWWPHALLHGLNPFLPRIVYAPHGIDIAHGTLMPGLAYVLWPLTALTSPLTAFNVAALLAPALAAFTTYLLCRALTGRFLPSLVGGWLFGFSSYMLGQEAGHLNLTLVFLVPVLVLLVLRVARGERSRRAGTVLLALALIGQISLSTEIFATVTVTGALALIAAWLVGDAEMRAGLRRAAGPLAGGYLLALAVTSPYLYYALLPGGEPTLPARTTYFSNDLLAFVLPGAVNRFGGSQLLSVTSRFHASYLEGSAYLGVGLLLALLAIWRGRAHRGVRLLGVMLAVTLVCSLGAHLQLDGHHLFPLPWWLASHLPLLGVVLPSRLVMYSTLIVAVLVAIALSHAGARASTWALALLAIVSIWPATGVPFWHSRPPLPALFTRPADRSLLRGHGNVLALPMGPLGESMLWQAEAGLSFPMAGGYVVPPGTPEPYRRFGVESLLSFDRLRPGDERRVARFVRANGIGLAVMTPSYARSSHWPALLTGLGWRGRRWDGAEIFLPGPRRGSM